MLLKIIKIFFLVIFLTTNNSKIDVRNAHSMAYNSKNHKIYLFGGANDKKVLNDLWFLEGKKWIKVNAKNKPSPRTFSKLVYDEENDRLILFGGSSILFGGGDTDNILLSDTWQFKNNKWEKIETPNQPIDRSEFSMVYDIGRKRVVLFGGYKIEGGKYVKLGDTWEFYNNKWKLVSSFGPTPRNGSTMVYDSKRKKCILFGGSTSDRQYGESKGETWEWNGIKWEKLKIPQPRGIYNSAFAYNSIENYAVRFGGWDGELRKRTDNTWILDEQVWRNKNHVNKPFPRNHSEIVFDKKNNQLVLYGGHDGEMVFGDTWVFKNNEWFQLIRQDKKRRINNGH